MILRDYQERFVFGIREAFRQGHRNVLGVAPTGMGKTACACYMVHGAVALGHRVLFAAGRRELIKQTVATLARWGLTDVRVIYDGRDEGRPDAPVIVGSVQTLSQPRWLSSLPSIQFGILDEAHHGSAATWSDLVKSQPEARWVGLSATPERADGKPLGDLFQALVTGPSIADLTARGFLVPCRIWAGPPTLKSGELALTPLEAYRRFADGQRAGIYCRDVKHARSELQIFQDAGIPSGLVIGASRDRDETLEAWRAGSILAVVSVGCLTEGFDLPELGRAILARKFGHPGQYLQVGGRIIRSAPGKSDALLVDLAGSAHQPGFGPLEDERVYSLTGKAISGIARDSFGQCKECGSMFLAGPRACPHCGAEIPVRERALPRSTGVGVSELTAARPRSEYVVTIASKYNGRCFGCGGGFSRGDMIRWATVAKRAHHLRCPQPGAAA